MINSKPVSLHLGYFALAQSLGHSMLERVQQPAVIICSKVKQGLLTIEGCVCSQGGLAIGASHRV